MHVFVSLSFGHLQGDVSQIRQESKEYQPLQSAVERVLRTTSSMFSVPPHRFIWENSQTCS